MSKFIIVVAIALSLYIGHTLIMRYENKKLNQELEGAKMKNNVLDLSYINDAKKELYLLNIRYNLGIKSIVIFELDNLINSTKKGIKS